MRIEFILLGVILLVVVIDFLVKKRKKNKASVNSLLDQTKGRAGLKRSKAKKYVLISLLLILVISASYYININWQTISDKVLSKKLIKIEYSGPDVSLYNRDVFTPIRKKIKGAKWYDTSHIDSHIYSSSFSTRESYIHKEHIWGNVHFITNVTIFEDEVFGNSILEFNNNRLVKIESNHINYESVRVDNRFAPFSIYTTEYDENDRIKSSKFLDSDWDEIFIYNHIFNDEDQLIETLSRQNTKSDYENNLEGYHTNFYYNYNDNFFLSSITTKKSDYKNLDIKIFHNDNNGNVIGHHSSRYECKLCDTAKPNSNEFVGGISLNYYTYDQYDNLIKSSNEFNGSDNYQKVRFMSYNYTKYDKNNNWLSREITMDQDSLNIIIQTREIIYY